MSELSKGALEVVKSASDFIGKLVGPASQEISCLLTDQAKYWRAKNLDRLARKFEKVASERGFNKEAIAHLPFNTAYLALEKASLEEDDALQALWASLFANALDPNLRNVITKVHIDLLGSLTSVDAQLLMLKRGWDRDTGAAWGLPREESLRLQREVSDQYSETYSGLVSSLSETVLGVSLRNLLRLQIIEDPVVEINLAMRPSLRISSRYDLDGINSHNLENILDSLYEAIHRVDVDSLVKKYFSQDKVEVAGFCRAILSKFEFTILGNDFVNAVTK